MEAGIELNRISRDLCEIDKNYLRILKSGMEILNDFLIGIGLYDVSKHLNLELKENALYFSFLNSNYLIAIIQPEYTIRDAELLSQKARLVTYLLDEEEDGEKKEIRELNFFFTVTKNIYKSSEGADYPEFPDFLYDYFRIFKEYILSDKSIKTTITYGR